MKVKTFLLMVLAFGMAFAGLSVPSWTLSQDSYRPGADGVITLDIANPLVAGSEVKTINNININIYASPEIIITSEQFVGDLEPGGSTKVSLPFKVSSHATSSIYSAELEITGITDKVGGGYITFSRRVPIPITVVNEPILSIRADRQLVGGVDALVLNITNNGGRATNLRVRIAEKSPVSFYGADEIYLPSVAGSTAVNITLDSRTAADGPTDVTFLLSYEDEIGIRRTDNTTIRMTVRKEKLDLKFDQMSDIITQKESVLVFSVRNDGNTELRDVRLSFPDSRVRLKDSGELKFGNIGAGQNATASGVMFAYLPPGVNLVNATISWIEKDLQKEESRQIPMTITSDADVGVYLEAKPLPLTIGSQTTISVLVSNLGSYGISNVDVSISSPSMRSLDISDRQYIGGLQSDDFSTVQFLMEVNATSEGKYPVYVTVNYRDQSGDLVKKVIRQDINVYRPVESQPSPLPVVGGLAILAALAWYFIFRKSPK